MTQTEASSTQGDNVLPFHSLDSDHSGLNEMTEFQWHAVKTTLQFLLSSESIENPDDLNFGNWVRMYGSSFAVFFDQMKNDPNECKKLVAWSDAHNDSFVTGNPMSKEIYRDLIDTWNAYLESLTWKKLEEAA